jgi:hypothetical protein
MKRLILLATVFGTLSLSSVATGDGLPSETPPRPVTANGCCPRAQLSGCPDDYCCKPWPRIWCLSCGLSDDYCPKPCPRLWTLGHCNLPDDYCRKACPNPCPPPCADHYTCGRPAPCPAALPVQDPPRKTGQEGEPTGYNSRCLGTVSPYHPQ